MWNDDGGTLRAVAWREICPWLRLFGCFRLALGFGFPLVLSAVAILVTVSGWALFGWFFSGDPAIAAQMRPHEGCPWLALTEMVPEVPELPGLDLRIGYEPAGPQSADEAPKPHFRARLGDEPTVPQGGEEAPQSILQRPREPFSGTFVQLSRPLWGVFSSGVTVSRLVFFGLSGLWALAVWAFVGGMLSRRAAVALTCEEHVGSGALVQHARSRFFTYFFAPLLLLVGIMMIAGGMGLVGVFLRWDWSLALLGLLGWPLMLLGGLAITYLFIWLALGWPLMWPATSVEGGDSFDALSRSNQYLFQRPLHYLFYVLVAMLVGWLGWLVVSNFAAGVVTLTNWAADWGADSSRWFAQGSNDRAVDELAGPGAEVGALGAFGAAALGFWCDCIKMLAVGYLYSYFWTASTCIYLLLRYDADSTEFDELFMEEDEEDEAADGLPSIETDAAGAPVVEDEPASPDQTPQPPPEGEPPPPADDASGER
jgi:hypothetical protein